MKLKYFKTYENFPSVNGMYDQGATGTLNRFANANPAVEFEENIKDEYTILYRGDSQKIDTYLHDKFDLNALFGPGLYLTDDYDIADTYTIKGDDKAVLYTIHFDNIEYVNGNIEKYKNPLQYCKNMFITEYLIPKIINIFDEYELHDFIRLIRDSNYQNILNVKNYEDLFYLRYGEIINKDESWFNEKYEKEKFNMFLNIRNYYVKATQLFEKEYSDVKFIPIQLTKKDNVYKAVKPNLIEGEVSKFKVRNVVLEKCFDCEIKYEGSFIEELVKKIFNKVVLISNKETTKEFMKQKSKKYYQEAEYYFKELFSENIYPIKNKMKYLGEKYLNMFWSLLISELKKQGYKGFKYNGGVMTGNTNHNAYCLWNLNDVIRIK